MSDDGKVQCGCSLRPPSLWSFPEMVPTSHAHRAASPGARCLCGGAARLEALAWSWHALASSAPCLPLSSLAVRGGGCSACWVLCSGLCMAAFGAFSVSLRKPNPCLGLQMPCPARPPPHCALPRAPHVLLRGSEAAARGSRAPRAPPGPAQLCRGHGPRGCGGSGRQLGSPEMPGLIPRWAGRGWSAPAPHGSAAGRASFLSRSEAPGPLRWGRSQRWCPANGFVRGADRGGAVC